MTGTLTITTRLLTGQLKNGLKGLIKNAKDAGESISGSFKAFGKIAVIIGLILATIKLIVGAWNKIKETNSELMAKIELIRTALGNIMSAIYTGVANLIGPIISKLADWILKLLAYINAIVKAFGGADIFAKSTSKSMKSTAKSAKETKKSLAGFDQINQLSDSSSGGAGGVGGGSAVKAPEITLPNVDDFQKKVENLKKKVKDFVDTEIKAFNTLTQENTLANRKMILSSDETWGLLKLGWWDTVQGILTTLRGIGELLMGPLLTVVGTFMGLFTGDWTLAITGIKTTIAGFRDFFVGIFQTILGVVEMVIGAIWGVIQPLWKKVSDIFTKIKDSIVSAFNTVKTFVIDKVINPIKSKFDTFKTSCVNIFNAIKDALKGPINTMIGWINKLIDGLNKVSIKVPAWVNEMIGKGYKESKWGFNIAKIPKLAQGGIVSNPGPGVNMGNYIAGERGAEAVIPLNDNTLQRLANMIPISIDLTNTIDGRVLNRRLETIRANDNFARNGVR